MSRNLNIRTKNINSKRLYDEINEFVESGLMSIGIRWTTPENRDTFSEILGEWLEEFQGEGRITQYNVICDDRNNSTKQQKKGIFKVSITYKQMHCLNVTSIDYELVESNNPVDDDIITY